MNSPPGSIPVYRPGLAAGARRGLTWYLTSLRLWRRSPFKFTVLALVPLVLEGLIQLIPDAGTVLSKVIVPLLAAGILVGVDRLARTGAMPWRCLFSGFAPRRLPGLLCLSLVGLSVFATQIAVAVLVYGHGVVDGVVWGHLRAHPALESRAFTEVLILPGLLVATLLLLAVPLFLFECLGPPAAVWQSLKRVAAAWPAFAVALGLQLLLMALALSSLPGILLLLVLTPLSTLVTYVAYRDAAARPLGLQADARPTEAGAER